MWLGQIAAVIRLEMKKTFLSRRGLWVYLLALAPVAVTTIHSLVELSGAEERRVLAGARPVSADLLQGVTKGMTTAEVQSRAGEPHVKAEFGKRGFYQYTDGRDLYTFSLLEGKVFRINRRTRDTVQQDTLIFASIFQFFFLRLAIFFGCVGGVHEFVSWRTARQEFALLPADAAAAREVLVIGKYLAGLIATIVIFTTSTALQMWTLSWHFEKSEIAAYMDGPGWGHALSYLGVTVLACVGYGSVFLAAGLLFKNPIIPAAIVEVWESANIFLPAALKQVSVIFYLQSLCPIVASPDENLNRFLKLLVNAAEPVSAPVAIGGLLVLTLVILAFAGRLARGLEINYSTD
ncbi:MAG: hypothetical protein WDO18_14505 [Acidobacteriota bacterium]